MAAISLFWDTNMVAVTSFEHTLLVYILVCIFGESDENFFQYFLYRKEKFKEIHFLTRDE